MSLERGLASGWIAHSHQARLSVAESRIRDMSISLGMPWYGRWSRSSSFPSPGTPYAVDTTADYSTETPTLVEFRLQKTARGTLVRGAAVQLPYYRQASEEYADHKRLERVYRANSWLDPTWFLFTMMCGALCRPWRRCWASSRSGFRAKCARGHARPIRGGLVLPYTSGMRDESPGGIAAGGTREPSIHRCGGV